MNPFPMVPKLSEGQIALVLTWGQKEVQDLDLHVKFEAQSDILCYCDFLMRECAGLKYLSDTQYGASQGSDTILFDKVGAYHY